MYNYLHILGYGCIGLIKTFLEPLHLFENEKKSNSLLETTSKQLENLRKRLCLVVAKNNFLQPTFAPPSRPGILMLIGIRLDHNLEKAIFLRRPMFQGRGVM